MWCPHDMFAQAGIVAARACVQDMINLKGESTHTLYVQFPIRKRSLSIHLSAPRGTIDRGIQSRGETTVEW